MTTSPRARVDRGPGQDEHALRLVRRETRACWRRARRHAHAGSGGPSMPGMRSGRIDGTAGTQFATPRPASRSSVDVRVVVAGELHLPDPDPVEAGLGVGVDVLCEGGVHRGDLRERELHRPTDGLLHALPDVCKPAECTTWERRFRQLLVDEVARACAEARAGMGGRADVPEAVDRPFGGPGAWGSGRKRKFWSSAHEPP